MNHKIIRLASRSYVISSFTPKTVERIINALRSYDVKELKDIPSGIQILSEAISIAIAGCGIFGRFKAHLICRRIRHKASIENLIEATGCIIELIPASEFYTVTAITKQFQEIIVK